MHRNSKGGGSEQLRADDQFAHPDGRRGEFTGLKCTSDKVSFKTPVGLLLVFNAISVVVFCTVFSWV